MSLIIDLKDAINSAIQAVDNTINFNFNKMQVADFPYVFLYFSRYRKLASDKYNLAHIQIGCVLEYMKKDKNNEAELWAFEDTFKKALLPCFQLYNKKITPENVDFKTVEGVLQMVFDLDFYIYKVDPTELMGELDLTLRGE